MKKVIFIFSILAIAMFNAFSNENKWNKELAFNLSFPITNNDVSVDVNGTTLKDSIDTNGAGFLFGGRFYRKDNGLTFLVEAGLSYASSDTSGFDEDFGGLLVNGNFGIGKHFGFNEEKGSFIPSFIIGYHGAFLKNTYNYYDYDDYWGRYSYSADVDLSGFVFEIGGNLYFSHLLGKKAGICASLDFTFNIAGFGTGKVSYGNYSDSVSFDIEGGTVNILPAAGFFIKL